MSFKYYLGVMDYIVIIFSLMVSAAIGIKFRYFGDRQTTTKEYLMAGRNMPRLPVTLSITVTMISAITMLSTPSEIYRYGIQNLATSFGRGVGMVLAAYVFVPVYFQCGVTTAYEFLDLRFGKATRYVLSSMFIVQMMLYMSVVLYAPSLALNAVTNLSKELSIIVFGVICTFYSTLGGLKAVLWTDSFQWILMLTTVISIYIAGIIDVGGITNIYNRANAGERLNLFNFEMDLTTRFTFWNCMAYGSLYGFGCFGTSQIEVQRLLSLRNVKRAKSTLLYSIFPVLILYISCNTIGLILYAVYYLCDPISNTKETGLTKYDQMVPYFIVSKFHSMTGLTGLCIAGIFSGSLSTISSALNSLSTVTVVDIIHPFFPSLKANETKTVLVARAVCVSYGLICICFAFMLINVSSIKEVAVIFTSLVDGPSTAVFTIGVLTRKGSGKSILIGLLFGISATTWITCTIMTSGYVEPPLPLSTSNCSSASNSTGALSQIYRNCSNSENCSTVISPTVISHSNNFAVYKVSFMWLRVLGFLVTLCCIFLIIMVTEWNKQTIPSDSKCLSPVTRLWMKNQETKPCRKDNSQELS